MNCAKCSKPTKRGGELNAAAIIKLLKVDGGDERHDKFKCPRCRAEFFFPK